MNLCPNCHETIAFGTRHVVRRAGLLCHVEGSPVESCKPPPFPGKDLNSLLHAARGVLAVWDRLHHPNELAAAMERLKEATPTESEHNAITIRVTIT